MIFSLSGEGFSPHLIFSTFLGQDHSDEAPSDEEGVVNEAVRKVLQLVQEVGLTGLSYAESAFGTYFDKIYKEPLVWRVRRVVKAAFRIGYTTETLCQLIRERSEQGGDAAKKN